MHRLIFAVAVAVWAVSPALADDKSDILAVINQFVDGFNKGDPKAANACAPETSIIDEFPPHEWHGPGACAFWMKAYDDDAKKNVITDGVVKLGKPKHVDINGDRAYVVIPSDYDFKLKGKPVKEKDCAFTFALQKLAEGWRITGWSWAKS